MTNPHYTNTTDLIAQTRARASDVEANFDAVEVGFDSVETLKADLASPALTGNPTAPTQTAGNNTTRIATTAFVTTAVGDAGDSSVAAAASAAAASASEIAAAASAAAALASEGNAATSESNASGSEIAAAASAALAAGYTPVPAQTGHSGKYLTTDGSDASWDAIVDTKPYVTSEVSQVVTAPGSILDTTFAYGPVTCAIDATRDLLFFGTSTAACGMCAVVFDKATNTFGTPVLVGAYAATTTEKMRCVKTATDEVVVLFGASTTLLASALSISGTTITVGALANTTVTGAISAFSMPVMMGSTGVIAVECTDLRMVAFTVSAGVVTFGTVTAAGSTISAMPYLFDHDGTDLMVVWVSTSLISAAVVTLSGTTLTIGTAGTATASNGNNFRIVELSAGVYGGTFTNTQLWAAVITESGGTVTVSATNTAATGTKVTVAAAGGILWVCNSFTSSTASRIYVYYNSSGTIGTYGNWYARLRNYAVIGGVIIGTVGDDVIFAAYSLATASTYGMIARLGVTGGGLEVKSAYAVPTVTDGNTISVDDSDTIDIVSTALIGDSYVTFLNSSTTTQPEQCVYWDIAADMGGITSISPYEYMTGNADHQRPDKSSMYCVEPLYSPITNKFHMRRISVQ